MMKFVLIFNILLARTLACTENSIPIYHSVSTDAAGPILNSDGYFVESFGGGAYMITNNQYQAMFLVSTEGVIVVDAPPTIGRNLLYAIGNVTHMSITHQVYSHSHSDHIGSSYLYGQKVKRIAHSMTREYLKNSPDPNRPLPDEVFNDEYILKVGNQTLHLKYNGPNHHPGNIFIYAPAQKVLMLVDIVFPGWVPYALLGQVEDISGYIKAHEYALAYDFDHYIGGHLTRSGNRTDVENNHGYVLDLEANCREAFSLGGSPPNATHPINADAIRSAALAINPGNGYAAQKTLLDAYSKYCNKKTNEKWASKLAATDVYGFYNAFKMIDSLRLELDVIVP